MDVEDAYPDYDWGGVSQSLSDACKVLQIIGIVSAIGAVIGGVLIVGTLGPLTAVLAAVGGVAGGLLVYVVAGGVLVLTEIAVDVRYSANIAQIHEEKTRKE